MKPDQLDDVRHRSEASSEREIIRQHVEKSRAFQRRMLREQEERCRNVMAEIKASLAT